jgi:hypothetical protein
MKQGSLSDYFVGAGVKVLKGTEVDPTVSRGHELQGVSDFKAFLGSPAEKMKLAVTYVWLADDAEPLSATLNGTWYDSRRGQAHREPEYRLYYPADAEDIVYRAKADDTLFLCQPSEGPLLALFCTHDSSIEQQLLWLFGLKLHADTQINQVDVRAQADRTLDLTARYILELIGVEVLVTEEPLLDKLLRTFGETFPPTLPFSSFARENLPDVDGREDPDAALLAWMDFEERLFMTLEKHIVGQRLVAGFMTGTAPDVDGFIRYSLSVQNRRKSRAGSAFANHVEALLALYDLRYVREATTEKRAGADFLFPDERSYHDPSFPIGRLTMLGAKTSCKDRWRQVLAEADRIPTKHLITLEPGISRAQTDEMARAGLQLVLPHGLHASYLPEQAPHLMRVADFLKLVSARQG